MTEKKDEKKDEKSVVLNENTEQQELSDDDLEKAAGGVCSQITDAVT